MPTIRTAEVEWIGGFIDGEGKIVSTTTGALPELEVTWQSRVDEDQSLTSPEELLAAAHASCFAMQFTSGLVGSGWEPEIMHVSCAVTFETGIGDHRVRPDRPGDRCRADRREDLRDRAAGEDHVPDLARARRHRHHARAARLVLADDEDEQVAAGDEVSAASED